MDKTNAVRIISETGIKYEHIAIGEVITDAEAIAEKLGAPSESVFKTLVTVGKSGAHYVFMVPACAKLDLKKAAKAAGEKAVEMIMQKELFPLTGYVHGGCSPIGMKKTFPTFIDETCILWDEIYFSAGKIGEQIKTNPMDFCEKFAVLPAELTM